jgi:hypothetical protein
MALEDIVFDNGDEQGLIVEMSAVVYTGSVSDIVSEPKSEDGALVNELTLPQGTTVIINNRRIVR